MAGAADLLGRTVVVVSTHPATAAAKAADRLLAGAPVTAQAEEEIRASKTVAGGRRDDVDGFGLSGRYFPQLSVAAQAELAASAQWLSTARAALADGTVTGPARRRVEREVARRDHHVEYLLGSVFRLARDIAGERVDNDPGRLADAMSEAMMIGLDAIAEFDATRNASFASYFASLLRLRLSTAVARTEGGQASPESWVRLAGDIRDAEMTLHATLGRTPGAGELRDEVVRARTAKVRATVLERQPKLRGKALEAEVQARLVRQGFAKAFAEIDEIAVRMRTPLGIDTPVGDDGMTIGDLLSHGADPTADDALDAMGGQIAEITRAFINHLGPDTAAAVVARLTGDDIDDDAPSAATVGRAMRRLRAVTRAPHAHWGLLAVEEADLAPAVEVTSMLELLAARALG